MAMYNGLKSAACDAPFISSLAATLSPASGKTKAPGVMGVTLRKTSRAAEKSEKVRARQKAVASSRRSSSPISAGASGV
eukprot:scaffold71420_cov31-Attheya_sp.AAC.1